MLLVELQYEMTGLGIKNNNKKNIRPGCHHHFDASGTSNAMFDELAERTLMRPLAGTKHTYTRLAIIIHCEMLALFSTYSFHL